jgi:transcription antitermination factor NusG
MHAALLLMLLVCAPLSRAQAPSRFVGTITAISGNALTVKSDAGEVRQVEVPAEAAIKRIAPGQKDLSTAETLQFSDLATGDRVLVKLDPDVTGPVVKAIQIVAIKQTDVAQKQQKDREDWQQRGTGGPVKSVDSASGVVVLSSGAGAAAKTITVHTTKATLLKRYAPASVRFDTAQPAPIEAIHAGDQLRARGAKNADGTEIAAEEVISGSFRNISGTITSADPSASTLVVKDLATKKQVTIHITPDAQMRRLPDMMARMLVTRLKATAGGPVGAKAPQSPAPSDAAHFGGGPGGDPQQMLNRAPAIQLADLKKGDAVMVVSTDGTSEVTAISLLAGVEPLLEAPAAQNLLSNWSMASGAAEAAQ